jgi:hypothetical protein
MASTYEALLLAQVAYLQATAPSISTQKVTSATASVTFSSISANFNHLSLMWNCRGDAAVSAQQLFMQINGNTGSVAYTNERMEAVNATTVTGSNSGATNEIQAGTMTAASATAFYPSCGQIFFPYASDATNYACAVGVGYAQPTATTGYAGVYGGLLAVAGAITSIKLFPNAGNFATGEFSLYGWI